MAKTIDEFIPTLRAIQLHKQKIEQEGHLSSNLNNLIYAINQLLKKAELDKKPEFLRPMQGRVSAPFAEQRRNSRGQIYYHTGIDIADNPANKTPIYATADGVVLRADIYGTYGLCIDIAHEDEIVSRYAHCSKLLVKKGETVKAGQQIAVVGSTGHSTGPHLHFEIRKNDIPQNPLDYILGNFKCV